MLRKIIIASVTLVFLLGLAYAFFQYRQVKAPINDPLNAIPGNAAIIFQSKDLSSLWKKVNESNIIWEELMVVDYFKQLHSDISLLDSLLNKNSKLSSIIKNQPVFLSAHASGADNFDFLFSASIPNQIDQSAIHKFIIEIDKQINFSNRNFESNIIYTTKSSHSSKNLSYSLVNGIFLASFNPVIVEDAISQLISGSSITNDKSFTKVYNTAGTKVDGNIFINYKNFSKFLSTSLNTLSKNILVPLEEFASWAAIDLSLKPNALMLNGFTNSNDSTNNYLNLFLKQKPQNIEITRIMPSNTATFLYFGFSNFSSYHKDYKNYVLKSNSSVQYQEIVNGYNQKYDTDIENNLLSWIGNEVAVVVTEPDGSNYGNNTYAIFRTAGLESARNALDELSEKIVLKTEQIPLWETYRDFSIKELNIDSVYQVLLGSPFNKIQTPFYTNIGKYIIFSNSINSLHLIIDHFLAEKTLQKDLYYNLFSENLSNEANIYLYSNIARSTNIYRNYVKESFVNDIDTHLDFFRKMEAIAFQITSNNNLFYNNVYLKHNPVYKQESTSLWETQLDTSISSKPRIILNHTNGSKEIFAQDDANKIYLISNTGKILWKQQLPEKIMSDVYQVDVFKNEKLQLLFNTTSKIYLLDRNGDKVEKFPVSLNAPASNSISLLDYDNNRNYRIMVACEDNKIYNYTSSGDLVKGWAFEKTVSTVKVPVQYFTLGNKDYLVTIDQLGKIYIFDRRGETRLILKEKMQLSGNNDFYIEKGKDFTTTKFVSSDSTGNIVKLNLVDELENINIKEFSSSHFFDYKDLDNDKIKEYIFVDKNELNIYNQNKSRLFNYQFEEDIELAPMFFLFPDNLGKIGVVNSIKKELWLFDQFGNPFENIPSKGETTFSIGDINKDGQLNILVGSGKNIYAYPVK